MAPGGIEPPRVDSKSTALSTELRGRARLHGILCERVVAVAQLVEPRVVIPVVAGSSPVRHLFFLQDLELASASPWVARRIPEAGNYGCSFCKISDPRARIH